MQSMSQPSSVKQGNKVGYPFSPLPNEWHPAWYDLSPLAQGLGALLFRTQHGNGSDPPGIDVPEDWAGYLCRALRFKGPFRRGATEALTSLYRAGFLVVRGGRARVLLLKEDVEAERAGRAQVVVLRPSNEGPTGVLPGSYDSPAVVLRRATVGNDSTPISQIRSDQIKEERETRAREATSSEDEREEHLNRDMSHIWDDPPSQPELPPTPYRIGHEFVIALGLNPAPLDRGNLEWIGEQPAPQREAALRQLQSDGWWRNPSNVASPIKHIVSCWTAYGAGRSPGGARGPAGVTGRPGGAGAPETGDGSRLLALEAELKANVAKQRELPRDSIERWELERAEADLISRVARLRARCS